MKCDCQEQMEAILRENTGDPEAKLCSGLVMVKKEIGGKTLIQPVYTLLMTAFYRDKKRDGTLKEKNHPAPHHNIIISYCPFCGEKLIQEDDNVLFAKHLENKT
jgi:hypothetical protein